MASKKKKVVKPLLISIRKCAYILHMSEPSLIEWIKEKNFQIIKDNYGQEALNNDHFKNLANDEERHKRSQIDIKKYLQDSETWNIEKTKNDINKIIEESNCYLNIIQEYHSNIHLRYNLLKDENEIVASIFLFGKIINMCHMFIYSIDHSFNSALLLIRTIDEAASLAQYFVVLKDDSQCQKDLTAWFRFDKSPRAAHCREKLAIVLAPRAGVPAEYMEYLSDELYSTKSKSIHHSFRDCSELLEFKINDDEVKVSDFAYQSGNVFRQFEIVQYFIPIINNVMQAFIICFDSVLEEEEKNKLVAITTKLRFP